MNLPLKKTAAPGAMKKSPALKIFGVGGAGGNAVEYMLKSDLPGVSFVALNTDAPALAQCGMAEHFLLGANTTRGLGAGGDPERGRSAAEEEEARLRALCAGVTMVFIVGGLGGGTATGAAPVLARAAKAAGALVLGIVTLPFDFEGARRQHQARRGLEQLKAEADGVLCLPNQKILELVGEHTSVVETFQTANEFLAQGVRGLWRLLSRRGLIHVDFADLCAVVQGRHAESFFATAEARGPHRAREAVEKLLASPTLEGGQWLNEAETVLVSLVGGADLTMAEVNCVMGQINRQCEHACVVVGAAIDEEFNERLAVTLVASRRNGINEEKPAPPAAVPNGAQPAAATPEAGLELDSQFLRSTSPPRPAARFVPPPPELTPDKKQQMLARQGTSATRGRKRTPRLHQGQLPLEIISKGRFDRSEPTILHGEDLDMPTFIRRGVALN